MGYSDDFLVSIYALGRSVDLRSVIVESPGVGPRGLS